MPPLHPPSHRNHPYIFLHRLPSHPHRTAAAYLLAFVWLTKLNENETKLNENENKNETKTKQKRTL